MFRHQGPARSERDNRLLAAYLALIGGFVNSAGFTLIGVFTSHVTGNIGRFSNDLVERDAPAALAALVLIGAFFVGAFVASMIVESNFFGRTPSAYGTALLAESLLLASFVVISHLSDSAHPRHQDMKAVLLCTAMGLQNSLVTRLSGAVVRTTHLTGVVTDLAIEAARWFRWWRGSLAQTLQWKLAFGCNAPERPRAAKAKLLLTISGAFMVGAVLGAISVARFAHQAMLIPGIGVALGAVFALLTGQRNQSGLPSRPSPHS